MRRRQSAGSIDLQRGLSALFLLVGAGSAQATDSKEELLDSPSDLAETFTGLTPKAFAIPENITTDPQFLEKLKAYIKLVYGVGEEKWSYAVPSFVVAEQKDDAYLRQMAELITRFTDLANKVNDALRLEVVELLQASQLVEVKALEVPSTEVLIKFSSQNHKRRLSPFEKTLRNQSGAAQLFKQVKRLLKLGICTHQYRPFSERFGQRGAFIPDGPDFATDRERFYHSTKMKLETILFCYQQQYQAVMVPGVSAATRTATLSTLGDFLRELHIQALACHDGMAFISEAYHRLTQQDNPHYWLLELRTAIAMAIVSGCREITGDGEYEVHAQTSVEREAAKLGYGIPHLPYKDSHEEAKVVQEVRTYARGRLLLEFPFNYNVETVCNYVAEKLRQAVKDTLQVYRGQVMMRHGQRQPAYDELKIKLRNPPLNFSGLEIDKVLTHSLAEDVYRIDERLWDGGCFFWSSYFVKPAYDLLSGLGIIHLEEKQEDIPLWVALVEAIEQRQMYRLYALLQLDEAKAVVSTDLIRQVLDKKSDQREPKTMAEPAYQRKATWRVEWAFRWLLEKLPDAALETKDEESHLVVIGMQYSPVVRPFELILEALKKRLAPELASAIPTLPMPAPVSLLEEDDDEIDTRAAMYEAKEFKRREDPAAQVALLHDRTKRLTDYANQFPKIRASSQIALYFCLLSNIPRLEFFADDSLLAMTPLLKKLRAIETQEEINDHLCSELKEELKEVEDEFYSVHIQIVYYQCGVNALILLARFAQPAITQGEIAARETCLEHLLELARYVPVDFSRSRWLYRPSSDTYEQITPLRAALEDGNQQQFLQLLALGADPTVEQTDTNLLILTASANYDDELFAQLVQQARLVFKDQDEKASAFVNRSFAADAGVMVTAFSAIIQHRQPKKLLFLLTRFKDVNVTCLSDDQFGNICWDWLDLMASIRRKEYPSATNQFLTFLYYAAQRDQLDPALERPNLSADTRKQLLAEQNRPLLEARARLLCKMVHQQGGAHGLPFLQYLSEQSSDVDLLLSLKHYGKVAVDFNIPRPSVESLLHRAIQQLDSRHTTLLLRGGADPLKLIRGNSAILCAVRAGGVGLVNTLLAWKKPGEEKTTIQVDQVDAKGKHLLCHAAVSTCPTFIFSQLLRRFFAESKEEGEKVSVRRTAVLLAVVQQLLQDNDRQQPQQINKFIHLLTRLDSSLLFVTEEDKPQHAAIYLLQLLRAVRADDWLTAIDAYCYYAERMGIAVNDELNPELVAMLEQQECSEFMTRWATQRTQPTGLLQVRALLMPVIASDEEAAQQRVVLAVNQLMPESSASRPLPPSLQVLKHLCFPGGIQGEDAASPLAVNFVALCSHVIMLVSHRPELVYSIVSLMMKVNAVAAADGFVQWNLISRYRMSRVEVTDSYHEEGMLLSALQSLKTTLLHVYPVDSDPYPKFLCAAVKQFSKLLSKDIHHYPKLFAFILQQVPDLRTLLFTHSSDGHGVYYTPLGYVIKAQLVERFQGYVARHQQGEEVGMGMTADSLGRTPLIVAVSLSWECKEERPALSAVAIMPSASMTAGPGGIPASAPIAAALPAESERKREVITPAEQQQREWKQRVVAPEIKVREVKTKDVQVPDTRTGMTVMPGSLSSSTAASVVASSSGSAMVVAPPILSLPSASLSPPTLLTQLLSASGVDLCASDLVGNTVLHHAMQGPLENFVVVAHWVQSQLSHEQWLALVRKSNHAGVTILALAIQQQKAVGTGKAFHMSHLITIVGVDFIAENENVIMLLEFAVAYRSPVLVQLISCKKIRVPAQVVMQLIEAEDPLLSDQVPIALQRFLSHADTEERHQLVESLQKFLWPTPDRPEVRLRFLQQLYRLIRSITTNVDLQRLAGFCDQVHSEIREKLPVDPRLSIVLSTIVESEGTLAPTRSFLSNFNSEMSHRPVEDNLIFIEYCQWRYTDAEWREIYSYRSVKDETVLYAVAARGETQLVEAVLNFKSNVERKEKRGRGAVGVFDKEVLCKTTQMIAPLAFYSAKTGIGAHLKAVLPILAKDAKERSATEQATLSQALTAVETKSEVNETISQLWGKDYQYTPLDVYIVQLKVMMVGENSPAHIRRCFEFFALMHALPEATASRYQGQWSDLLQQMQPLLKSLANQLVGIYPSEKSQSGFLAIFTELAIPPLLVQQLAQQFNRIVIESVRTNQTQKQTLKYIERIKAAEQEAKVSLLDANTIIFATCQLIEVPNTPISDYNYRKTLYQPFQPAATALEWCRFGVRIHLVSQLIDHPSWREDAVDEFGQTLFMRVARIFASHPHTDVLGPGLFTALLQKCRPSTWLRQDATEKTVMDHLLGAATGPHPSQSAEQSAYLLMQALTREFKQLTAQRAAPVLVPAPAPGTGLEQPGPGPAGAVTAGNPRLFRQSALSQPEVKNLATQVALEMMKYYAVTMPTHHPAYYDSAASLRTYLQQRITDPTADLTQLIPAVWQVPEFNRLLVGLKVTNPSASVTTVVVISPLQHRM